jgi:hypothetical protein
MGSNDITIYEGGVIKRVENVISITNKLLTLSNRQQIINLFVSHPEFFENIISLNYPLNEKMIDKFIDRLS